MTLADFNDTELEAALYRRLGREHGLTDIQCPKCLHHHLQQRAPELLLPQYFDYSLDEHHFDWSKKRLDQAAKLGRRVRVRWQDLEHMLLPDATDGEHMDHLPDQTELPACYIMHIRIRGVGEIPVICDGQHRASRAFRDRRDINAVVISSAQEPGCRVTDADMQEMFDACQRSGFLVWEVQVQYAVIYGDGVARFGRIVAPLGAPAGMALFQPARNVRELAAEAHALAQGSTIALGGDVTAYAALARRAMFKAKIHSQNGLVPVVPILVGQLDPEALLLR